MLCGACLWGVGGWRLPSQPAGCAAVGPGACAGLAGQQPTPFPEKVVRPVDVTATTPGGDPVAVAFHWDAGCAASTATPHCPCVLSPCAFRQAISRNTNDCVRPWRAPAACLSVEREGEVCDHRRCRDESKAAGAEQVPVPVRPQDAGRLFTQVGQTRATQTHPLRADRRAAHANPKPYVCKHAEQHL